MVHDFGMMMSLGVAQRRNNRLHGMLSIHAPADQGLRAGPAPVSFVSLGRWASLAAAAGKLSRGCRVCVILVRLRR